MIGIYKIENLINHKCYIGQSVHIERRWTEHCLPSANSIIAQAIKKYGKNNFSFQILEECSIEDLDSKEYFYIEKFNCVVPNGYNVTNYIDGKPVLFSNYDKETFLKIVKDLEQSILTIQEIGEKYDLNNSTIYRINNGEIHFIEDRKYPIREISQKKGKVYCKNCGKEISSNANLCVQCYALSRRKINRPDREELKDLIRNNSFTKIGKLYGVTDNTIRKWCKNYNLPHKVSEIKRLNPEEWKQV